MQKGGKMSKLRTARARVGMTQAELGRQMGIDPSIVRHVEAGRLKPYPRFRRLAAQILDVGEGELFPDAETAR